MYMYTVKKNSEYFRNFSFLSVPKDSVLGKDDLKMYFGKKKFGNFRNFSHLSVPKDIF